MARAAHSLSHPTLFIFIFIAHFPALFFYSFKIIFMTRVWPTLLLAFETRDRLP